MLKNGHEKNHVPTVELFANTIGAAFDWLVAEDGAAVPYVRSGSGAYSGEGRGAGVVKNLTAKFEELGGTLFGWAICSGHNAGLAAAAAMAE